MSSGDSLALPESAQENWQDNAQENWQESLQEQVDDWVKMRSLSTSDVDCVVTVMLKILDGKCKMKAEEKVVMTCLYDATRHMPGKLLGEEIIKLIKTAREGNSESLRMEIYEKRLLAETQISRPVMKAFKARIRREGLFDQLPMASALAAYD